MRIAPLLALALTACGGGERRPPPTPPTPAVVPGRVAAIDGGVPDDGGATAVASLAPGGVPHLAAIGVAATSRRADAVVSIDVVGEVRLWTALDGSAPPRRLDTPGLVEPRVERAGDDLVVGGVLPGGVGYLGLHHASGAPPAEATLDSIDGDVIAVVPTIDAQAAFVARADQSLELYTPAGARTARVTLGRERVRALAAAGPSSAIAVLRTADDRYVARRYHRRGDALLADADVVLPRPPLDGAPIAVSPDGKRLALLAERALAPRVRVDGAPVSGPTSVPPPPPPGTGPLAIVLVELATGADAPPPQVVDHVLSGPAHLGFTSDRSLQVNDGGGGILTVTAGAKGEPTAAVETGVMLLAVGDEAVIGAHGAALSVLRTGRPPLYLGYRVLQPRTAELSPDGRQVAITTYGTTVALDTLDGSAPERVLELPGPAPVFVGFLDAGRLLVVDEWSRVTVRDAATGAAQQEVTIPESASVVLHPRRGWVFAVRGRGGFVAVPLDPASPTPLGAPITVDDGAAFLTVVDGPVDGPIVASLVDGKVRAYTAAELTDAGALAKAKKKRPRPVSPMAGNGDDAGHFYALRGTNLDVIGVDGAVATLDLHAAPMSFWPLPGGGVLILSEAAMGVTAFGIDGTRRWSLGLPGLSGAAATPDHRVLAVLSPGGLVTVDAATGAPLHTRCAWGFGAWDAAPTEGFATVAPICR